MQPGDGVLARGECLHVGMQLITQMNVSNVGTLNACFECFNKIVIAFIHTSTLTSPPNLALARIHHHTPSQLNPTPKHTNTYKHKYTYTLKHTPERTAPAVFAACTPRPLHFQAAASVEAAAAGCRPQHSLSSLLPLCIQSGKSTCLSILPYSFSCVCVCARVCLRTCCLRISRIKDDRACLLCGQCLSSAIHRGLQFRQGRPERGIMYIYIYIYIYIYMCI
jgi:hypothetical protein